MFRLVMFVTLYLMVVLMMACRRFRRLMMHISFLILVLGPFSLLGRCIESSFLIFILKLLLLAWFLIL